MQSYSYDPLCFHTTPSTPNLWKQNPSHSHGQRAEGFLLTWFSGLWDLKTISALPPVLSESHIQSAHIQDAPGNRSELVTGNTGTNHAGFLFLQIWYQQKTTSWNFLSRFAITSDCWKSWGKRQHPRSWWTGVPTTPVLSLTHTHTQNLDCPNNS